MKNEEMVRLTEKQIDEEMNERGVGSNLQRSKLGGGEGSQMYQVKSA